MLQREGYSFCRVRRRKRLDRIGQAAIIGATVTGIFVAVRYLVQSIAKLLGRRTSTIVAGMATTVVGFTMSRKLAGYLIPGMAPADVLNKANKDSNVAP
jgi:putative flippase GtrA